MRKSKIIDIYMKLRNIIRQMRCHNYIINKTVFDKKTWLTALCAPSLLKTMEECYC